jgi:aspartate/methionine/tyrosine aminotransferase
VKNYKLNPEKNFELDFEHLESLLDKKTKVIVIINPSNPTGSVMTKQH